MHNFQYLSALNHDEDVYFLVTVGFPDGTSFSKEIDFRFPKSAFNYVHDKCRYLFDAGVSATVTLSINRRDSLYPLYVLITEKFPF